MVLILKILEATFSKYTTFDYELGDLFTDLTVIVVGNVIIDFLLWL